MKNNNHDNNQEFPVITYPYARSRFVKRLTFTVFLLLLGTFVYFIFSSSGTYLSAWFISFVVAGIGLFVMSMPRYIRINPGNIEIHCVVELTTIPLNDIKRITKVSPLRMKYAFPLLGSYGFGGYFGYYFDWRKFVILRLYATKWSDFVLIHDIFDDRYVISCSDPDGFIKNVMQRIKALPERIVHKDMNDPKAEERDTAD